MSADVRWIGSLRDSRFLAAQNSASRKGLRSFALFIVICAYNLRSSYADNAQNMRGISVIVRENVAAIAFIDDFPLRPGHTAQKSRKRMNHAGNLVVRACPSRILAD